ARAGRRVLLQREQQRSGGLLHESVGRRLSEGFRAAHDERGALRPSDLCARARYPLYRGCAADVGTEELHRRLPFAQSDLPTRTDGYLPECSAAALQLDAGGVGCISLGSE